MQNPPLTIPLLTYSQQATSKSLCPWPSSLDPLCCPHHTPAPFPNRQACRFGLRTLAVSGLDDSKNVFVLKLFPFQLNFVKVVSFVDCHMSITGLEEQFDSCSAVPTCFTLLVMIAFQLDLCVRRSSAYEIATPVETPRLPELLCARLSSLRQDLRA